MTLQVSLPGLATFDVSGTPLVVPVVLGSNPIAMVAIVAYGLLFGFLDVQENRHHPVL